jgi:hypothetical protein
MMTPGVVVHPEPVCARRFIPETTIPESDYRYNCVKSDVLLIELTLPVQWD